jgi:putative ABC transport system permease protein
MGVGVIVIALAAVIGGTALLPSRHIPLATLACVIGSVLYRLAIGLALSLGAIGVTASDVNILTAVLVTLALVAPGRGPFYQGLGRRWRAWRAAAQ